MELVHFLESWFHWMNTFFPWKVYFLTALWWFEDEYLDMWRFEMLNDYDKQLYRTMTLWVRFCLDSQYIFFIFHWHDIVSIQVIFLLGHRKLQSLWKSFLISISENHSFLKQRILSHLLGHIMPLRQDIFCLVRDVEQWVRLSKHWDWLHEINYWESWRYLLPYFSQLLLIENSFIRVFLTPMPKVSIITTTYKHDKFISHTIDSLLNQSFTDWELLIGDDSPDNATWNIIVQYTEKYPDKIHAWHHSPNKGIVGNTNFLLEHISKDSEFVAFLEWDDVYTPDNLEKKLDIFQKYREVQLVYSDLSFINSQNTVILESFFHYRGVPFFQNETIPVNDFILLPAWPIASWSTGMVRREMLEKYWVIARWEDKRYSIADYDFYFQVATHYPVYGIDRPLTQYRRHSGNLSGANGGTSWDIGRWIDIVFREGQIPENIYKTKKSWLSLTFAIFALEHGQKKEAWRHFLDAYKFHPFYKTHYKIGILGFLMIPAFLGKKILRTLIRRGD